MGSATGVVGYGSLPEQIQFVGASSVAGTKPTTLGVPTFPPAVQSASFNTGGIQRKGANVAMARFMVGVLNAAGNYTVKVQHSNDDGVTDAYTNYTVAGWGANATAAGGVGGTASNTDTPLASDLRSAKQWVRYAVANTAGTSAIIGITAFLGAYDTLPASGN